MLDLFRSLLSLMAVPMKVPRPYGAFHLLLSAWGIAAALALARRLARKPSDRVLTAAALFLAVSEVFKQGFLYFIVNNQVYDWWYFPFQLCSLPMYLGLLLPLFKRSPSSPLKIWFYTFIQDFGLLGGFMALTEPSGLLQEWWFLTLHGLLWHFILIFMGFYCYFAGFGSRKLKAFLPQLGLLAFFSLIATAINVFSHPYGNADMFYISPYYPNGQLIFHQIALKTGVFLGNVIYLAGVAAGAFLIHAGASLSVRGNVFSQNDNQKGK